MSLGGARLKNGLSERENKFAEIYLADKSNNATKAAIEAGYSETSARQTATTLLNRSHIKKYLDKRRAQLAIKTDITREYMLGGFRKIFDDESEGTRNRIAAGIEINRMCGFNEPEKHLHEHTGQISTVLLLPANGRQ